MSLNSPACPVCHGAATRPFFAAASTRYWQCTGCAALFLDPAQRPGRDFEEAYYRLHHNRIDDPGYRRFLGRLAEPLLGRLAPRSAGLDYGCGPGPALAAMLAEAGHRMQVYDPLFFPEAAALARRYQFVTCTETAEHFHQPAAEFARLRDLLEPGGLLAVMTAFPPDAAGFAHWHYRRDPTHVVFYAPQTFRGIAARLGMTCEIPARDVVLLGLPP